MLIFKAAVGTEIYDLNEEDIRSLAVSTLQSVSTELEKIRDVFSFVDNSSDKQEGSFIKKLFPDTNANDSEKERKLVIGADIALAITLGYFAKVAEGSNHTIPWISALLLCAIGPGGWMVAGKLSPTTAMEKFPPYERLCLKNIPYVIFLDMLIATAQRKGGVASDYLPAYRP